VRNTNFGSDAEQLITKMREAGEALALGRPERAKGLVLLSFNAHLAASFLLSIGVFLFALMMFFTLMSNNYVGALAAIVAAFPILFVGMGTIYRDERVRKFGLVIAVGGLLTMAAINVSPQFFHVDLLEKPPVPSGSLVMGIQFLLSALFFGSEWKKYATWTPTPSKGLEIFMRIFHSPWLTGPLFLSTMLFVSTTWVILYRLAHSVAAVLALVGAQLLVVGLCYVLYRKSLDANPAPARS
jgi:hypothetical protein